MKFSRIIFLLAFFFYLISCQNGIDKKSNEEPKKNTVPTTNFKKIEKSTPELNRENSIQKQPEKEEKKKKLKAIDTLMPLKAIP